MFVFRSFGMLLAVPLVWLARLADGLGMPLARQLYTMAWWLNRDGQTACLALAAITRVYGDQVALSQAQHWMQLTQPRRGLQPPPDAAIAASGGLLAMQNGQVDLAWQLLGAGKQLGSDRDGMLELLEWLLTAGTGSANAVTALARQLEGRRDLQPLLSRQVLTTLLWEALQRQRFDEVSRRAHHLLSIEDLPQARMALWALAKRDGDPRQAQMHLQHANLEPRHKLSFQILGNMAIGFVEEARALQAELRKLDPAQADLAEQVLAASPEEPA